MAETVGKTHQRERHDIFSPHLIHRTKTDYIKRTNVRFIMSEFLFSACIGVGDRSLMKSPLPAIPTLTMGDAELRLVENAAWKIVVCLID